MSTLEQITKLIDAGYNKAEIAELLAAETQEKAEDKQPEQTAAAGSEAQTTTTKENVTETQNANASNDRIDEAIAKMEKLAESLAKISIMNSQQPERESQDDFLAKIINPYYNKEEK